MIPFKGTSQIDKRINVVSTYKHVGTRANMSDSLIPEIHARMADTRVVFNSIRNKFLADPSVSLQEKLQVSQAVMLAKGLFNAGSWPILFHAEYKKTHVVIMKLYRSIACDPYSELYESDDDLISRVELVSPRNLLRILRAGLLIRLLRTRPTVVWSLLCAAKDAKRSWLNAIEDDLLWYKDKHEFFERSDCSNLGGFFSCIAQNPKVFKKVVLKVCGDVANNTSNMWAKCKSDLGMCAANVCNVCAASFSSKQELALHSFRKHGVQRDMRRYVDTEHCFFCLQHFHTRERLICHLEERASAVELCIECIARQF